MPKVFIPTMLLSLSGGVKQVQVDAANLRQVIDGLDLIYPGIKTRLLQDGQIRPNLAVAIDGEVARLGLLEKVGEESEVHFVPAIGGGTAAPAEIS
jgi:molybdopterin synthase sulfur carrier subunit